MYGRLFGHRPTETPPNLAWRVLGAIFVLAFIATAYWA